MTSDHLPCPLVLSLSLSITLLLSLHLKEKKVRGNFKKQDQKMGAQPSRLLKHIVSLQILKQCLAWNEAADDESAEEVKKQTRFQLNKGKPKSGSNRMDFIPKIIFE